MTVSASLLRDLRVLRVNPTFNPIVQIGRRLVSREGAKPAKNADVVSSDAGFTLLEVIVSFAIAGLVVAIIIPTTLLANKRLHLAAHDAQAEQVASSVIEAMVLRGKPFSSTHIGDWQASGTLQFVDDQPRARFQLARLEARLTPINPDDLPIEHNTLRLVPVTP